MIRIDTTTKLLDIEGKETPQTVGMFLSEICWVARENPARAGLLSKKFREPGEVELKAEDAQFIKKTMNMVGARAGESAQVLALLGEVEE